MMSLWEFTNTWLYILTCAINGLLFRMRRYLGWWVHDRDAIQSMYDALDPKSITYSQVWEDVRTLKKALSVGPGDRVVCVCSGGDNALALLNDNPDLVLAVDYSPAQVAVAELKKQAIRTLDHQTFLYLLGVRGASDTDWQGLSRLEIYGQLLRPNLSGKVLAFWEQHKNQLEPGLIHAGIYEQYFRTFGRMVVPLVHSTDTIHKLLEIQDSKEQREYYDNVIDTKLWRFLCRAYFGDVLVGRCPAFYERSSTDVGNHFLSRMRHVMRDVPAHDNFYLEYILTGEMTGRFSLPEYMQAANLDKLKQRVDQLVVVEGDILNILEKSESSFDAIDMSNIFDFVPLHTHERYRKAAVDRSHNGTRVVHWTFVPVSDEELDFKPFAKEAGVDLDMSQELNNAERAWFYQTFVVQKIAKGDEGKNGPIPHRNGFALKAGSNGVRKVT